MSSAPRLKDTVPTGCRCPQCRHDAWMDATLRHNAEIARIMAHASGRPERVTLVEDWFARFEAKSPTPPTTDPAGGPTHDRG
jgi:hypothetical protein